MRRTTGRALVILALLAFASAVPWAQAAAPKEGRAGLLTGTHFDLDTPGSLVTAVDSTLQVDVMIHATPRSFVMPVSPVPGTAEGAVTRLTLSGLLPATVYYRYTDDFGHVDVVQTDGEGRLAFDLALSAPRLVILQPNPSTVHLRADGTGCPFIGTWDPATLTCLMRRDVAQTIEIEDDGLTLDGNGFAIDGTSVFVGSSAVLVGARSGVTVRNLVIDGASIGVIASGTSDSRFEDITMINAGGGFLELFQTPGAGTGRNTFRNNSVSVVCDPSDTPCGFGFSGLFNNEDTITGNLFAGARFGITTSLSVLPVISGNTVEQCASGIAVLASLSAATVEDNTVTGGETGLAVTAAVGCEVRGNLIDGATGEAARIASRACAVTDNTFANGVVGLNVVGRENTIVHNRFIANAVQALVAPGATDTLLSQPPRIGGNHWSDFDEAAEGCDDLNGDGYCDAPYAVSDGEDAHPWAADLGWMDVTPPATGIVLDGIAGNAGWFRSAVAATLTGEDEVGGSGVLRSEYGFDGAAFTPADGPVGLTDQGPMTFFYRSVDRAGNAETALSVDLLIDSTPPSVTATLDPPANADGWNGGPVTVDFTCDDAHSGVASCPPPQSFSGEGADQGIEATAFDVAGNPGSVTPGVNIDMTPPEISFTGGCGTTAVLNQALTTDVAVVDDLSGVAAQSVPDGPATLPTGSVGPHSLPAAARDHAGNPAAASCDYGVIYDFLGAGGFMAPVDPRPVVNMAKAGSAIPVKWQLPDGLGGFLSSLAVVTSIQARQVSCSAFNNALADPIETTAAGESGLHFDPESMQYVYVWKTTLLMTGRCFVLSLGLSDGRSYHADFRFKR